ncbi:subtilisin-like protein [Trametes versicolor FP-101664 SS1]|uniref:subtilisin-like protein n=1 Tax=Trametes versicolor (strain FP-101664) TaxID=717944 RepID=UPI0004621925|nr:subtilisin-like protein [Trametes versicolor FP-101664 SS1]EIW56212.1 subtilisin-like protein [Trametes versicolor FP-101664 SS1]
MVNSWGLLTFVVWAAVAAVNPVSCDAHGRRLDPDGYTDSSLNVHEARSSVPLDFFNTGPAPAEETLKLRFALAQSTPYAIVDALYKVSDPKSPQYGQHLSKSEVEKLVAPSSAAVDAVNAWLQQNSLNGTALSPSGDWVGFEVPVGKANTLFNANFSVFEHGTSGKQAIRTMLYSLPPSLQGHVDLIHPTTSFPAPVAKGEIVGIKRSVEPVRLAKRNLTADCTDETIPECVQFLYDIPLTPATNASNRLGVTGRFGNSAHFSFLQQFLEMFRPDMNSSITFSVVGIDGGTNDQTGPSVSEGELDIQYTVGLATNVPVTYYFLGDDFQDDGLDGYLDEVNTILAEENPPQVLTTSYGMTESAISFALTDKLCKAYAQLGARGTSILFASGDSGVGCPAEGDDLVFQATFPSNCPYVTSVGGTSGFPNEVSWPGSSGGFSNYFARPSYQDAAVDTFLAQLGDKNAGAFNRTGRAFPDISAAANGYIIFAAGLTGITGTSASSPVTASIIALLNDRLLSAGKPPLGFLNPWLYSEAAASFKDIVSGNNSIICDRTNPQLPRGFDTAVGWDPVTGLGTPSFTKLLALLGL